MPPDLALSSTLIGSNYPCLELIFMVPKVFEPLKFDCILVKLYRVDQAKVSFLLLSEFWFAMFCLLPMPLEKQYQPCFLLEHKMKQCMSSQGTTLKDALLYVQQPFLRSALALGSLIILFIMKGGLDTLPRLSAFYEKKTTCGFLVAFLHNIHVVYKKIQI